MSNSPLANLKIDGDRLWRSLMDLARIGATPKGGVARLALTALDGEARRLFVSWCEAAGLAVEIDAIGNIFARRAGRNPDLPPVMLGSHIDTQPTGGKFDGCFGVMAGLEVIRTLDDLGIATEAPIEVVAWTNEEGSRFPPCMMGSGVFTGRFGLEETLDKADGDGLRVGDELARIGFAGSRPAAGHAVGAYFEAHIEQGPVLEDEGKTIGVVIGTLGQKWFDLTLTGQEAHAGPTPMRRRRDALLAASHVVQAVNRIALDAGEYACGTVGCLSVFPDSRNVIPGRVDLTIDFRHWEAAALDAMVAQLRARLAQIARDLDVAADLRATADFPPLGFHPECVAAVRQAAGRLGFSHRDIVSGAGHDAIFLAEVAPAAMIFVPCEDGISHNEAENAKPEDLAAGASVLLHAALSRAGIAEKEA
ncbi:N-carbamoyl-L-amino acid hydrolase [uncultured Alphaproteobacteria bacterium]|uniref:N-carbamoyl-L-amino acid hydrolase n=1 Tax=uncultured Alphaproteobacteria bacterium TaxID=91750 RepID=A0A212IYA6_9PROT|nr:N-carbamoyl-L-amino acid hydrolase [uncultured Alphaproteobacteria bacterium]